MLKTGIPVRTGISLGIWIRGASEFDGDEFGQGECVLFLYGPDADGRISAIKPLLESSQIASRGYAIKRYGDARDPQARTVRVM